jgi:hypothetical protein
MLLAGRYRLDRTKKITSALRRTKARNAFVGAVPECFDIPMVGLAAGTDSPGIGSLGSFCTMRVLHVGSSGDRYAS